MRINKKLILILATLLLFCSGVYASSGEIGDQTYSNKGTGIHYNHSTGEFTGNGVSVEPNGNISTKGTHTIEVPPGTIHLLYSFYFY